MKNLKHFITLTLAMTLITSSANCQNNCQTEKNPNTCTAEPTKERDNKDNKEKENNGNDKTAKKDESNHDCVADGCTYDDCETASCLSAYIPIGAIAVTGILIAITARKHHSSSSSHFAHTHHNSD